MLGGSCMCLSILSQLLQEAEDGIECERDGILSILSQLLRCAKKLLKDLFAALAFQFFPSCCRRTPRAPLKCGIDFFQFFPSCFGSPEQLGQVLQVPFNSFPVASGRSGTSSTRPPNTLSILSQLLHGDGGFAHVIIPSLYFQFFPSCFGVAAAAVRHRSSERVHFQFFPSCCRGVCSWACL